MSVIKGQTMSDLIERSEVLKQLWLNHKDVVYIDKNECARRIEAIPSARPKGEWIKHEAKSEITGLGIDFYPTEYECSCCGLKEQMYFINSKPHNYCPNCGSDNRGGNNSE